MGQQGMREKKEGVEKCYSKILQEDRYDRAL